MTNQPTGGAAPVCYRHPGRPTYITCQRCGRPICPDCMVTASVGYQCPGCVADARRTTRQARTPYGGTLRRGGQPVVTYTIMGLNVAVWLLILATGWHSSKLINRLSLLPKGICQAGNDPSGYYPNATNSTLCTTRTPGHWINGVADGSYWQVLTSVFAHVEILHIASNMLALYVVGPQLEQVLGRTRYLALYLVSGLAGSAVALLFQAPDGTSLGASGAIFGLFGALAVVVHKVGGDLRAILTLIVINLVVTFTVANISWEAHLGGLAAGAAVGGVLAYAPPGPRRSQVQVGGIVGVLAVVVVVTVVRIATLA